MLGTKKAKLKTCSMCGKKLSLTNFYSSQSPLHKSDKLVPICKKCIIETIDIDDVESVKDMLRAIDKPFLYDLWDSTYQKYEGTGKNTFGYYIKNASMHQYEGFTWKNSIFKSNNENKKEEDKKLKKTNFKVTDEMVHRWGSNYDAEQIRDLEKFYHDMRLSHTIVTPQHVKALIMMCKMQLKMDEFLEANDMTSFSKLHDQYQKLLQSSGLRPIDKVGGDEATGMRSFSHIYEEVEKDGFIQPASIDENQDIIDKTIQYILNYNLKLLNQQTLTKPPVDTPKVDDVDE